jgi:hypothetical protein
MRAMARFGGLAVLAIAHAARVSVPPEQVRVTYGYTADTVVLSWATGNTSTPSDYSPIVRLGESPPPR